MRPLIAPALLVCLATSAVSAQGTRLLRDPSLGPTQIAFTYGGDLWVVARQGGDARRLTSTPAVEADPQFSPDGKWIAFTAYTDVANKNQASCEIYIMRVDGTDQRRLTNNGYCDYQPRWGS